MLIFIMNKICFISHLIWDLEFASSNCFTYYICTIPFRKTMTLPILDKRWFLLLFFKLHKKESDKICNYTSLGWETERGRIKKKTIQYLELKLVFWQHDIMPCKSFWWRDSVVTRHLLHDNDNQTNLVCINSHNYFSKTYLNCQEIF